MTTSLDTLLQTGRLETRVGGATILVRRLCGGWYMLEGRNASGWQVVCQYQTTAEEAAQAFDRFVEEFRAYLDRQ
ncbi:MAG TPA: hypothetical protein H9894_03000 [Candidatus Desulfovibrio intestinipullorum]|uniref:Uncharacterized protein n=1 Tax=Candidatus Desulfovibrio intestinipullorum TaxID=2838536 RepID=A0A9D1TNZ7_9BACT|nr:hypothetical protein [Candidatus Desulfovibrio intestinipullorum]